MAHLLLVKHALPEIQPDVPAKHWLLGEAGRAQSLLLAERLRAYRPEVVISSEEPKAAETGCIVADILSLPRHTAPELHEHDVTSEPYFDNPAAFEEAVKLLFSEPDKRSFGESASEALRRFTQAVKVSLEPYAKEDVVLVAHGRINTLLVAAHNDAEPFTFWKNWPLAGFAVLSRPEFRLLESPQPLK